MQRAPIRSIVIWVVMTCLLATACSAPAPVVLEKQVPAAPAPSAAVTERAVAVTSVVEKAVAKPVITTPTPKPLAEPSPTLGGGTGGEDVWGRIRAEGKLSIGTSVDFPPYAFYTAEARLDGFDVALARELGRRLGLAVEVKDFAAEGLLGALQLGQIDLAAAAIAATPGRAASVGFSRPYYVTRDALLAREPLDVPPVQSAGDLVTRKLGVQRGSAYETWVRETLIAGRKMPAANLVAYADLAQTVQDLKDRRIELVLLDYGPAQAWVQQGGVRLAGQGIARQPLAFALPLGAVQFKEEVDRAIEATRADGTLARLAEQYLGINTADLLPLPTPASQPPPGTGTPAGTGCVDGMAWVMDLTYDDRNMTLPPEIPAGTPFAKGWRVRNAGTCTWDSAYTLVFVRGNAPLAQMGSVPAAIDRTVPPGAEHDLFVPLVAPNVPGVYQGFWQMRNGQGVAFGERIWVGITVRSTATPTPAVPMGAFIVDRTRIVAGECATFAWNIDKVREVYFYAQGEPYAAKGVAGQDSQQVCPAATATYELRIVHYSDAVETRRITITVDPQPSPPTIAHFTLTPDGQIRAGGCVEVTWEVKGGVTNISLRRGDGALWDGAPAAGSLSDCPPGTGNYVYSITATGSGGASELEKTLTVLP